MVASPLLFQFLRLSRPSTSTNGIFYLSRALASLQAFLEIRFVRSFVRELSLSRLQLALPPAPYGVAPLTPTTPTPQLRVLRLPWVSIAPCSVLTRRPKTPRRQLRPDQTRPGRMPDSVVSPLLSDPARKVWPVTGGFPPRPRDSPTVNPRSLSESIAPCTPLYPSSGIRSSYLNSALHHIFPFFTSPAARL